AATRSTLDYRIHGMDCAEEVSVLRRQLAGKKGIYDLRFDVLQAKMTVEFDPGRIPAEGIEQAVAETGMKAEAWKEVRERGSWWQRWQRAVLAGGSGLLLAAAMVVQGIEHGGVWQAILHHDHAGESMPALAIGLCLAAMALGSIFVLPKAWYSLKRLQPDMNLLVTISMLGASYLGEYLEGASLAFLFATAALLESFSLARARKAVIALMKLAPGDAAVVHHDHEHRTSVDQVPLGAIVRVRPGERLPCDGCITAGASDVNQAMITGESVPVWKEPGDDVFAGTMNGDGLLDVRTTRTAADTTLSRIVRMVERAQQRRAPSEQFVERFSRIYTPSMLLVALLVFVVPPLLGHGTWSEWFYQSMVILLISCPCALVISTPVSVVAALASAARNGVLVKGGAFLEEAARIKAVAFDKTGVLTQGEPRVQHVVCLNGKTEPEVLERLAALESASTHPLANAVRVYAKEKGVRAGQVSGFQNYLGRGAEAEVGGEYFWAGSVRMLEEKGFAAEEVLSRLPEADRQTGSLVVCGTKEQVWAAFLMDDPVRAEAKQSLARLRGMGVSRVVMLTGDNRQTAERIGKQLSVEEIHAEMLPSDKAEAVEKLRAETGHVTMVGDGVNDAQAMAAANLSIALGSGGFDAVLETADVVFLSGGLARLPFLLAHARRTAAVIRQNVVLALALKAVFLVLAFMGWATLWMAVAADMGATLLVTFNGLRLLHARVK
ncbi:MAG: heavy metal translocating P-type ATPase, partial [Acidobacteriota bacterium]